MPEMEVSTSLSPGMPVAGFGLDTIDHRVPFQCSISVVPAGVAPIPPLKLVPTAQALGRAQVIHGIQQGLLTGRLGEGHARPSGAVAVLGQRLVEGLGIHKGANRPGVGRSGG